ncbi:MAG: hypothetical protein HZB61_05205 [Nitrospirae bacterium]|nr:hypothetical protein [Nitrospirota bacterium]
MIFLQDYEEILKDIGKEYFIHNVQYVSDIKAWAKENKAELSEPHQVMKLVAETGNKLTMVIQSDISSGMLDDVIKNLSIRWALKDTATNIDIKLNSLKKRMAYCFLKEYARSVRRIGDEELVQDEWALNEMETLGFFKE